MCRAPGVAGLKPSFVFVLDAALKRRSSTALAAFILALKRADDQGSTTRINDKDQRQATNDERPTTDGQRRTDHRLTVTY